jgi:hypothetical protein
MAQRAGFMLACMETITLPDRSTILARIQAAREEVTALKKLLRAIGAAEQADGALRRRTDTRPTRGRAANA